ncbi:hypothetical protein T12_14792, partial [Trichinella patagoniensis]
LEDKESCGGAVWTDLEIPAGIDRKDHVETCRHFTIHAIVASKLVPVDCCYVRLKILANKTSINKAAVLSLYPQTIICNFEIALKLFCQ